MKVASLWIYPIKGAGGIEVESAHALESGFKYDRRLMLIDKNNKFISQRTHPKLATLSTSINESTLKVTSKEEKNNHLEFNVLEINKSSSEEVSVWKSKVQSHVFESKVNEWFSTFLKDDIRLVKQVELGNRSRWVKGKKIGMSYADGYPFLVLSKESVNDLSKRMNENVDLRQFRANIILDDCEAYYEDTVGKFSSKEAVFKMIKPCKRCPVIDIHQDTGESRQKVVKSLNEYRRELNSVIFGMNAALVKEGVINVGEKLIVD
jgi:uncharacterized protein YcbX